MDPRAFTLAELEGNDWGTPTFDSNLGKRCDALRRKKLGEMTVEDLRMLIGQNIGLEYLMPIALDVLEANPLAEGDYYEGDLLVAVLHARKRLDGAQRARAERIYDRALSAADPDIAASLRLAHSD